MKHYKKDLFSLLMILLILVILSFFVYTLIFDINIFKTKKNETIIQSNTDEYIISHLSNDPLKGDNTSPVAIYLFADYELEEVGEIIKTINELLKKYPQDLYLVWKDLPLPKHYFAKGAALAARCALDENKYWEYNQALLNREEDLSLDLYRQIAKDLELNLDNFLACYQSGKYLTDIENNVREAYVLDVADIPTIFLNQEKIEEEISFDNLDKMISNLLR